MRILGLLDDKVASPSELALRLNAPLGNVSYHVRILASLDLIRLVSETPRRGSVEHHYTAVAHPVISDEAWAGVPDIVKNAMIGAALEQSGAVIGAAAAAGGFNRPGAQLTRSPVVVDDEGWDAIGNVLLEAMKRVEQIGEEAAERLAESGAEGARHATALIMFFASPEKDAETAEAMEAAAEHRIAGDAHTRSNAA